MMDAALLVKLKVNVIKISMMSLYVNVEMESGMTQILKQQKHVTMEISSIMMDARLLAQLKQAGIADKLLEA